MRQAFWQEFSLTVLDGVYEPREDSFLLADTLNQTDFKDKVKALELGCGSGLQSLVLAGKGLKVLAADLNPLAVENVLLNAEKIGFKEKIEAKESDLFEKVEGEFDIIVFNPPYVPSERIGDKATDGGEKGRVILDKFLAALPNHLSTKGECFFLQSDLNGSKETEEILKAMGLSFKIVARKRLFFEELLVYRCSRL